MAVSYSTQRVTSDGTLSTLALSIEYFDRTEIQVFIGGVLSSAWTWTTPTSKTIQFTNAPIANGVEVLVRRSTDISDVRHNYSMGAQFTYGTLDENFRQILHIAQESKEGLALGDLYNDLDMHGYKIRNVGTATQPNDVVTLAQYQADALGAGVARDEAEAAATAAAASAAAADADRIAAANSASAAANSAGQALTYRDTAQVYANTATGQATAAIAAKDAAEAAFDSFDDRYLGAKVSNPTTDNDGNPLQSGTLYWNSSVNEMRVWNGTAWSAAYVLDNGYLAKNQNLADLQSIPTARTNLGLVPQTAASDSTSGRLLTVGAFGRGGGKAITATNGNMDAYTNSAGTWAFDATVLTITGSPDNTASWLLDVIPIGTTQDPSGCHQVAYRRNGLEIWQRSYTAGAWGLWSLKVGHQRGWKTLDLNTITASGFYNVDGPTSTNLPVAGQYGHLIVHDVDSSTQQQTFVVAGAASVLRYERTKSSGTWNAWEQVPTTSLIGWGRQNMPYSTIPGNNLNNVVVPGLYHINSGAVSTPSNSNGTLIAHPVSSTYGTQVFIDLLGQHWYRANNNGTWTGWSKTQPILDSGYLVPTLVNGFYDANGFRYRKINGIVYINGTLGFTGSWTANTPIFYLPVGFRPATPVMMSLYLLYPNLASQLAQVAVNTDGTVTSVAVVNLVSTPTGNATVPFGFAFPAA